MAVQGRNTINLGEGTMGHFDVTFEVGTLDQARFVEVSAGVDTGSTFTQVPRTVLERLGLKPHDRVELQLANGENVERDVGDVAVRLDGRVRLTTCVFAEEGEHALLGVITLEQFLLGVDTINSRLVPTRG